MYQTDVWEIQREVWFTESCFDVTTLSIQISVKYLRTNIKIFWINIISRKLLVSWMQFPSWPHWYPRQFSREIIDNMEDVLAVSTKRQIICIFMAVWRTWTLLTRLDCVVSDTVLLLLLLRHDHPRAVHHGTSLGNVVGAWRHQGGRWR